jgi:cytosine/adenosine deaminase-related metal-dependent hydrolase
LPKALLLKNALVVATMDDAGREIAGGAVLVRGNQIVAVGPADDLPASAEEVIDLGGYVVIPGLVNTHHHFFQTLTRAFPGAQDAELFGWLKRLYPVWTGITPEMIRISNLTAMAELLASGCTTSSDHLYLYPNGSRLEDSIDAAREIGIRFHACRGAMTLGESHGGLPPDRLTEREDFVLADMQRVIETHHDASRFSMLRVALAPCSPFTVTNDLMREAARMARHYGVRLHTHLAENDNDVAYTREHYGCTPTEYCEQLGWLGDDVWHAHCVKLDEHGIERFAATGTGVAHCPTSNMRLASGIAPVRRMMDRGVRVGLGVDGSASNDSGGLLAEARQAMLLQRVGLGPAAMTAREALRLATRGGASVLGRDDIGALAPGMAADIVAFNLSAIEYAGALHDPLAALAFCAPPRASFVMVNGQVVVRGGVFVRFDESAHAALHNQLSRKLVEAAR